AVPDVGGLGGRQLGQPRVVRRVVDGVLAVELLPRGARGEVVVVVRDVVADTVRPTVEARLPDDVPFDLAVGAALGIGLTGAATVVGRIEGSVGVDGGPGRVAEAHRRERGPRALRPRGEHIALGDRVPALGLRGDAQDLAAQIAGV